MPDLTERSIQGRTPRFGGFRVAHEVDAHGSFHARLALRTEELRPPYSVPAISQVPRGLVKTPEPLSGAYLRVVSRNVN